MGLFDCSTLICVFTLVALAQAATLYATVSSGKDPRRHSGRTLVGVALASLILVHVASAGLAIVGVRVRDDGARRLEAFHRSGQPYDGGGQGEMVSAASGRAVQGLLLMLIAGAMAIFGSIFPAVGAFVIRRRTRLPPEGPLRF